MREAGGRSFWVIALTLSIIAHAGLLLLVPDLVPTRDVRPIMKVRLATVKKKSPPVPAPVREEVPVQKNAVSKKEAVPKKEPPKKADPAKAVKIPAEKAPVRDVLSIAETTESQAGTAITTKVDPALADTPRAIPPQAQPERVVEIDSLEVIKKVLPDYSSFSRKHKEEGTVIIIVTATDGRVVSAEIESSSGYPRLDESALRAVRKWLFKNSGTIRVRVPVTFRLK